MRKLGSVFAIGAALVLAALIFDANTTPEYMAMKVSGSVRDTYVDREPAPDVKDLLRIRGIHNTPPNHKWVPAWNYSDGRAMDVRLYEVSEELINELCPGAWACTLNVPLDAPPAMIVQLNSGIPEAQQVSPGSCIIFVPYRDPEFARTWFYGVGHEFAHCAYGNFHPEVNATRPDDK